MNICSSHTQTHTHTREHNWHVCRWTKFNYIRDCRIADYSFLWFSIEDMVIVNSWINASLTSLKPFKFIIQFFFLSTNMFTILFFLGGYKIKLYIPTVLCAKVFFFLSSNYSFCSCLCWFLSFYSLYYIYIVSLNVSFVLFIIFNFLCLEIKYNVYTRLCRRKVNARHFNKST